jgi:hypothetical protein
LSCHIRGKIHSEGFQEKIPEENICDRKAGSNRRLDEPDLMRSSMMCAAPQEIRVINNWR